MLDEGYWQALLKDVENESVPLAHVQYSEELDEHPTWERHRAAPLDSEAAPHDAEDDWARAEALLQSNETVEVVISGYNRGGLLADFGRLQGFVPASHLLDPPLARTQAERLAALAARVGGKLTVRVVEIERSEGRLILSERLARQDGRPSQALENLRPGQICRGRITSLCPFGAFVDLGGFEGLLHVSELSWGRVASPAEVVQPGDVVDLLVLDVRPEEQKVALSLKRLRPDPWEGVEQRYHVGQVVNAVVTNVTNFGAFARLEEGLEGLIHVSELAEGSFLHPRNVVREGDCVRARVLHVDGARRRLALTLRACNPAGQNQQGLDGQKSMLL
jgi:small subunit ribosomal protein S1